MPTFNALWIDDLRPPPTDTPDCVWTCARSFHEAILKLELIEFDVVSFDHDIASFYGSKEMTGYDVALWLASRQNDGDYIPQQYLVHTANPVGRDNIQSVIDRYLIES